LALAVSAQTNGKIGVINIQAAIASTKDGQKAGNDLQQRFGPKKTDLDKRQVDIRQLQDQLAKAEEAARPNLTREIDQKTKSLNRDMEDARAELDQQEQKVMNDLGGRIVTIIDKYAKDHGYTLIVDVSNPQTPVLYASETINITKDIVELYDKETQSMASAATPAAKPMVPSPKPATPQK
jgi:outer membrane protein